MRYAILVLVAAGLALGVFFLWPDPDQGDPTPTQAVTTTTTTEDPASTTSTGASETTTSTVESLVVTTVEEAEEILRELWFGWFEGIYNEDEERIREVVILDESVETAKESFGVEFQAAPKPADISFRATEVLRSDVECVAVWTTLVLTSFREGESSAVEVLRWTQDGWKRLSTWAFKDDLWEADCESSLRS